MPQTNKPVDLRRVASTAPPHPRDGHSYGQILKSSSIIGGAQALTYLIRMIRTKVVAVLLGPGGVGLVGLYESATKMVGTLSGLGITSSAVRQVAEADSSKGAQQFGRTVVVLRRACWFSGILGTLLTAILAWPLSVWTFGNGEQAWPIAVLGLTLLLSSISGGQMALIQGIRRIGDLARLQVLSVIAGTIISVGLYAWLGKRGIISVLLVSAAVNLGLSWWFVRRIKVPPVRVTLQETLLESRNLVSLGLALMWSGLLIAGVGLASSALITRKFGIDTNGIYQAAWAISAVFAGFILNAMGTDFYPRLTTVASDNSEMNHLVNEQTEVGILLALPGLLGTLVFSPLVIRLLYSGKFVKAGDLLTWLVLGMFGCIISWPLGYIQLAKGATSWYLATETLANIVHLVMIWIGIRMVGLLGIAIAYAMRNILYTLGMILVAARLSGFRWSSAVLRLLLITGVAIVITFCLVKLAPKSISEIAGGVIFIASAIWCPRQICIRLGPENKINRTLLRVPLLGRLLVR